MILADDFVDPFADMIPIAMNLGGDIPTEDVPIKDGDSLDVQDSGHELQHGFVGYDD